MARTAATSAVANNVPSQAVDLTDVVVVVLFLMAEIPPLLEQANDQLDSLISRPALF